VDDRSCIVVMMLGDNRVKSPSCCRMQLRVEPEQIPAMAGLLNSHFAASPPRR
jgi:heat-inducible transcriptional repressor